MSKKNKEIKILFYTCTARAFRTTLIGHLHEISKKFDVVLLSEKLDGETGASLLNKELFPKIKKIVNINQFHFGRPNIIKRINFLGRYRNLYKLVESLIKEENPDIVITGSDVHSLFEICINRIAKKNKSINVVIQPTLQMSDSKNISKWFDFVYAHQMFSPRVPFLIRYLLIKIRKYIGYFVYFWIFPLTIGKLPFFGLSSYVLKKGNMGNRDADYCLVFSERDKNICIKDKVDPKKLFILPHPLETETREIFRKIYFSDSSKNYSGKFITLVLPDIAFGLRNFDNSEILPSQRLKEWVDIAKITRDIFEEYQILLKPHPNSDPFLQDIKRLIENEKNISIIDQKESADKYIEMSDVIIGLPMSASTVLFTASLQNPGKKIISLNFDKELLGDCFKNFDGIDYIEDVETFKKILLQIKKGGFEKKSIGIPEVENKVVDLLEKILKNRK